MSDLEVLKKTLDTLGQNWEEFKTSNDTQRKEIKDLGTASGQSKEALDKINKALDKNQEEVKRLETSLTEAKEMKSRIDALEVALKRGGAGAVKDIKGNVLTPDQVEYKNAFKHFLTRGDGSKLDHLKEAKGMSVNSDQAGGYLVTPDFSGRLISRIFETSPIRQLATVVTIGTDAIEGMTDLDQAVVGWVAEEAARPDTATPDIGKYRIPVHEMYAKPKISQQLLEDSNIDPESFVAQKVADRMARTEETAFVAGNGVGKPRGLTTYPDGTTWKTVQQIDSGAAISGNKLLDSIYALKQFYRTGASWLMTRTTQGLVRQLVDSQNRYLWQPGLIAGQPAQLLGYNVNEANDFGEAVNGAIPVGFGNWAEAYMIVDRLGVSVLRDPYSSKPYVEFYTRRRVGGDVVNFDAYKLLAITS